MNKPGGALLIALGVALIPYSVYQTILVVHGVVGSGANAYAMGKLAGTAVIVILFVALGLKSILRGRQLYTGTDQADETTD